MPHASALSRRHFLTGALAAPLLSSLPARRARGSTGTLNMLMWSDYLPEAFQARFTFQTGITINQTEVGSNEEILEIMQTTGGSGFDLVSPTNQRALQWAPLGLLQPFDLTRVKVDQVNPAMLKIGTDTWNFDGAGTHWLPHIWGTEGIAYRTDRWQPEGPAPSYGDVWSDALTGQAMGRAQSMMVGAGLFMEASGAMEPGSVWAAYSDEDTMRRVWGQITEWTIARKSSLGVLWNDAEAQRAALLGDTVSLGQTWDGPALALKSRGEPVHYQAPVEGAMAWVDGLAMPKTAQNIDEIYAFIDFAYDPENAGLATQSHGYNSPVVGADRFAGETYARNFAEAYPGDSLSRLNPWPSEAPWYAALRAEFVAQFEAA
ncbi:MAG: extracellular solute-binding protein [Pseudomonadota bacterium]